MNLFISSSSELKKLNEVAFKLERDIQNLFEQNLGSVTGLQLVRSEFSVKNYRIDSLAYDPESKLFVIIEYKRDKNYSVFDQGITYLGLMLEYRSEFIIEYNERLGKSLKRDEVDWSQSRVIFVAPSFTDFQQNSTNFKDFAIELWEIKQFEGGVVVINPIKKSVRAESIKPLTAQNTALQKVADVIKVYTEEEHLRGALPAIAELYQQFKIALLNLFDDTDIKPKKHVIGFTRNGKIFADVCIQKNALKFWINAKAGELTDLKGLMRNVTNVGHWGSGDFEVVVKDDSELEYLLSLIKQVK